MDSLLSVAEGSGRELVVAVVAAVIDAAVREGLSRASRAAWIHRRRTPCRKKQKVRAKKTRQGTRIGGYIMVWRASTPIRKAISNQTNAVLGG